MLRLLLTIFIVLTASILSIVWLNGNSGEAVFVVLNQKIETTFTAFALSAVLSILALQVLALILYRIYLIPKNIKAYYNENKIKKQLGFLSEFILNINNEAIEDAEVSLKKMDSDVIDGKTLSVCSMMFDKISPDKRKYKNKLINLTRNKETSEAGLYELIRYSINNKEWAVVSKYCEDLWKKVKSKGLTKTYFRSLIMNKDWDELTNHLDKSRISLAFSKSFTAYLNMDEHMAVLTYVKFMKAKDLIKIRENDKALQKLEEVVSNYPNFSAAVYILTKEYIERKELKKALKILTDAWKIKPNYKINPLILEVAHGLSKGDFDESHTIVTKIIGKQQKDYESHLLIAASALEADLFNLAHEHIREALDNKCNLRANLLMAEYCERSHGNKSESIEWMRKAYLAAPDTSDSKLYFDFQTFLFSDTKTSDCLKITA